MLANLPSRFTCYSLDNFFILRMNHSVYVVCLRDCISWAYGEPHLQIKKTTHVSYRAQYGINACRFLFFVQSFGSLLLARGTDLFRHYEMILLSAILKLRSETRYFYFKTCPQFICFVYRWSRYINRGINRDDIHNFFKCIDWYPTSSI